ncbi:MAG: PilZ domain-containing protein [Nitrospirota bacterium]|nr:PilZ domain-containing protein [Nitrospirota bacterium]
MKERRKFRRESLAPYTEIFPADGGEPVGGYPIDMSRGGLALETETSLPLGSNVTVAVHFDPVVDDEQSEDAGDAPVEFIQATVKRIAPAGKLNKISVEFIGLSETEHPILVGVLSFIDS